MSKNGLELISSEEINAMKEFTINTSDSEMWGERISNAERLSQNLNTAIGAFGCLGVLAIIVFYIVAFAFRVLAQTPANYLTSIMVVAESTIGVIIMRWVVELITHHIVSQEIYYANQCIESSKERVETQEQNPEK